MHCCDDMHDYVTLTCLDHGESCPDRVIVQHSHGYGLPIHDMGGSYIRIQYCPWCGHKVGDDEG